MAADPIVQEVRRVREKQAGKHGFRIDAIVAAARRRQRLSGVKVVSFVRKSASTRAATP